MDFDYLIIGSGIVGLAIARDLNGRFPHASIAVLEKEPDVAYHSSGRNSGVLHAGFYYSKDSLKAKFTRDGNRQMTEYCLVNNLRTNQCKKVVVA
jgi:L-2-hydroxyglutarate oxidase LhgO